MTRYVLECPRCEARFDLKRYQPDQRVRCRKCRSVMAVPGATEPNAPQTAIRGELRDRLVDTLGLKRLALASVLLLVSIIACAVLLARRAEAPPPAPEEKPPRVPTLETMAEENLMLVLPLGTGFSWEYLLKGGATEQRRVVLASRGLEDVPEFDLGITGSLEEGKRTLRVMRDGLYWVGESSPEGRFKFQPPLRLVPTPLYTDDAWSCRSERTRDGGGTEIWKIDYAVRGMESIEAAGEKRSCFRVDGKGTRGTRSVQETLWYCRGVGLVRRRTEVDGRVEEATLTAFKRP